MSKYGTPTGVFEVKMQKFFRRLAESRNFLYGVKFDTNRKEFGACESET